MKTKTIPFMVAVVAFMLTLSACGPGTANALPSPVATVTADPFIVADGRLEPVRYIEIALNTSGLVSVVLVKEGDRVTAGQVLARIKNTEAQTLEQAQAQASRQLTAAYQALRDAQSKLDHFDVPSGFTGLTPGEAVSQTLDQLNTARAAYEPYRFGVYDERYGDLDLSNPIAYKFARNNLGSDALEAKKRLDDAWARYRRAIQWMDLEASLQTAQADVIRARTDYDALQDPALAENTAGVRAALANAEVRAPFAGVITNLELKAGGFASAGQPAVTLEDTSNWVVKTTDLTEMDVVRISQGQPVTVVLDALPDVELKGHVLSVSQNFSKNLGNIVYEVTVLLVDRQPAMRWGMTAVVKFEN